MAGMVGRVDINNVLLQMRQLKAQAQLDTASPFNTRGVTDSPINRSRDLTVGQTKATPDFSDMLTKAINGVNKTQQQSSDLAKAYEIGDPQVDITRVMVASEKATVSFQAMVQVRNKLIAAYEDVMKMPI